MNSNPKLINSIEKYINFLLSEELKYSEFFSSWHINEKSSIFALSRWFVETALDPNDATKWKDGLKENQKRIFKTEVQDRINRFVSYHNLFRISSMVITSLSEAVRKELKGTKMTESIGHSPLTEAPISDVGILPIIGLETGNPTITPATVEDMRKIAEEFINSNKATIFDKIKQKEPGFPKLSSSGTPGRVASFFGMSEKSTASGIMLSDDVSGIVNMIYLELRANRNWWHPIANKDPAAPDFAGMAKAFETLRYEIAEVAKLTKKEGYSDQVEKEIFEILKKHYPDEAMARQLALDIENSGGTQEENVEKAKWMTVVDDSFLLMGFATYFYGREMLYPTSMGIDLFKQAIFKDMWEEIKSAITTPHVDSLANLLKNAKFGTTFKEIPNKIKDYPDGLDDFVSSVINKEKLFDTAETATRRAMFRAVNSVLRRWVSSSAHSPNEKKEKFLQYFKSFMVNPSPSEDEVAKSFWALFHVLSFIRSDMLQEVVREESTLQWAEFLSDVTGDKTREQIYNLVKALPKTPEARDRFDDYSKTIRRTLKSNDEHFKKFLKHFEANYDKIKDVMGNHGIHEPIQTTTSPSSPSPSPTPEIKNSRKLAYLKMKRDDPNFNFKDVSGWEDNVSRGWINKWFGERDSDGEPTLTPAGGHDSAAQQGWLDNLFNKIRASESAPVEEKLIRIMESIIRQMLKEENGKKELCN